MTEQNSWLRVCAGVDVLVDRLQVDLWAFASDGAMWPIRSVTLSATTGAELPWAELWAFLSQPVLISGPVGVPIAGAAIDSGGANTREVYTFVLQHQGKALRMTNAEHIQAGRVDIVAVDLGLVNFDGFMAARCCQCDFYKKLAPLFVELKGVCDALAQCIRQWREI